MATGESTFGGNWNDLIGEYASWVINVPAWNISSINVQDAINELDTEKVSESDTRIVHTTWTEIISGIKSFTSAINIPIAGTPTTLTNPTLQSTNSVDNFTQISIQNKNATVNASADIIAYPNNNANDTTWFVDIGITSSVFSQAAYAITTPNDAYLFWSAVSGAGKLGNLIIATDSTGSNNSIIFWVNWFTALNKERMRLDGITGALSLWFSAVANGVLKLFSSANAFITTIQWGTLAANATLTLPNATSTLATTGLVETLTNKTLTSPTLTTPNIGVATGTSVIFTNDAITATANAATIPITHRFHTVTNNSAATLTITLTTSGATDWQLHMIRILDFSAVAQTLTFVNTENSDVTIPSTSNGSTTLPRTVWFQYNSATSKWRCIANA